MPSLTDWKPSDFKYISKVLNILTEYKTCSSKFNLLHLRLSKHVEESIKPCFLSSYLARYFCFLSTDRGAYHPDNGCLI